MHRQQRKLLAIIEASSYHISYPPCPGMREFLFSPGDPDFLDSLETFGDARLAICVARVQQDRFPRTSRVEHRKARDFLLSNRTLQCLAVKLGAYLGKIFCKGVANGIEIFMEALAEMQGEEAAYDWIAEAFTPLIQGLVSRSSFKDRSKSLVVTRPRRSKRRSKAEPAGVGKCALESPELFDWDAALPLPSSAISAIQTMSNREIDTCADLGFEAWRHHTYAVLRAEAGFLPSSVLTRWRENVADNKQRLQTVASLLGVPAVFGGRVEAGKVALGAFLVALLQNHRPAEVAAARQWLTRLLAPGLRIAKTGNNPALDTFPRKRSRNLYEFVGTTIVLERLATGADHAHVQRTKPAASDARLVLSTAPSRIRKRAASESEHEESSPPRKRLRYATPAKSTAGPSRIPLAPLSTNYRAFPTIQYVNSILR
ncbi:hypothetical protein C8R45DRAFT_1218787 [Mycena sanguinolenta]|nr:hypothetical protein C8R45DRAFT_1218787 [Mycena sanguinolenta]